MEIINWCFESKGYSLRFLRAMPAEWAEYSFAMFVHEPAERMLLLSMKLARFSLMRVVRFGFR